MKTILGRIPSEVKTVITVFAAFFIVAIFATRSTSIDSPAHYFTSTETGMYGVSKLKLLAEKSGYETNVLRSSFSDSALENAGVIFILSPEKTVQFYENTALNRWVESGGIAVFGSEITKLIDPSKTQLFIQPESSFPFYVQNFDESDDSGFPVYKPSDSSGNESAIAVTEPDIDSSFPLMTGVAKLQIPLIQTSDGFHHIAIDLISGRLSDKQQVDDSPELEIEEQTNDFENLEILASYENEPVIISESIGEGKLISIANPLIFSNGFIEAADNIMLAHSIISLAPDGKTILFDDYHHGISSLSEDSAIATGWGRTILFILLVGLLAIASKAIRFIPPRAVPPPARRSQVEYLKSLAQILRRAKASNACARIITRDLKSLRTDRKEIKQIISDLEKASRDGKVPESLIKSAIIELIESENNVINKDLKSKIKSYSGGSAK